MIKMAYMSYFARCINIISDSLLAQFVKYDVHTTRKIKSITYHFYHILFMLYDRSLHCSAVCVSMSFSWSQNRSSATLVCVLESCPVCQKHSHSFMISCNVKMSGSWSPSLLISRVHPRTVYAALSLVNEDFEEHVNLTRTLGYHVSITVPPKADYTSEIVFQEDRRPAAATATNVPSVNCTWNSSHTRTRCKLHSLHTIIFFVPFFQILCVLCF